MSKKTQNDGFQALPKNQMISTIEKQCQYQHLESKKRPLKILGPRQVPELEYQKSDLTWQIYAAVYTT